MRSFFIQHWTGHWPNFSSKYKGESYERYEALKSQFVTSKEGRGGKQKQPLVFTENGVAMLSVVLKSDWAIEDNIAIMRIYTKLRSCYAQEERIVKELG